MWAVWVFRLAQKVLSDTKYPSFLFGSWSSPQCRCYAVLELRRKMLWELGVDLPVPSHCTHRHQRVIETVLLLSKRGVVNKKIGLLS